MKVKEVAAKLFGNITNDPSKVQYILSPDRLEYKANQWE